METWLIVLIVIVCVVAVAAAIAAYMWYMRRKTGSFEGGNIFSGLKKMFGKTQKLLPELTIGFNPPEKYPHKTGKPTTWHGAIALLNNSGSLHDRLLRPGKAYFDAENNRVQYVAPYKIVHENNDHDTKWIWSSLYNILSSKLGFPKIGFSTDNGSLIMNIYEYDNIDGGFCPHCIENIIYWMKNLDNPN